MNKRRKFGLPIQGKHYFVRLLPWASRARVAHGYYGSGLRPDDRFPNSFRLHQVRTTSTKAFALLIRGFGGQASVRHSPKNEQTAPLINCDTCDIGISEFQTVRWFDGNQR